MCLITNYNIDKLVGLSDPYISPTATANGRFRTPRTRDVRGCSDESNASGGS